MSKQKIIKINCIDQTIKYPTGCESVSSVMLLKHLGIEITVEEFIRDALECRSFKEYNIPNKYNIKKQGPNPNEYFVGSPYDHDSFGCYAPVIEKALKRYLSNDYIVENATGYPIEELIESINKNIPVIFWATIDLKEYIGGPCWMLENNTVFQWRSNEHCMLLVGYDDKNLYFNDPMNSKNSPVLYNRDLALKRHKEQYEMAILVKKK